MALFRPGRPSSEEQEHSQVSHAEPEVPGTSDDVEREHLEASSTQTNEPSRLRAEDDAGDPDMGEDFGDAQTEDTPALRADSPGEEAEGAGQAPSKTGTWTAHLWESAEVLGHKLAEWERKLHPGTEAGVQSPETLTPLGDQVSASEFAPLGSGPLIQESLQNEVQPLEGGPLGIEPSRDRPDKKREQPDSAEARHGHTDLNRSADAEGEPSDAMQGLAMERGDQPASPGPLPAVLQRSEGPVSAPAAPPSISEGMGFGLAPAHVGGLSSDPQVHPPAPLAVQPPGEPGGEEAGPFSETSPVGASTAWHPLGAQVPHDGDARPLDLGSLPASHVWTRVGEEPPVASPSGPVSIQSPFGFGLAGATEPVTVQLPQDAGVYSPFGTVVSDILHSSGSGDAPPAPGASPHAPAGLAAAVPPHPDDDQPHPPHDGGDAAAAAARRPQAGPPPDTSHGPPGSPRAGNAQVPAQAETPLDGPGGASGASPMATRTWSSGSDASTGSAHQQRRRIMEASKRLSAAAARAGSPSGPPRAASPAARVPVPLAGDVEFEGPAVSPQRPARGSAAPPPTPATQADQALAHPPDSTDNSLKVRISLCAEAITRSSHRMDISVI